MEYTIGWIIFGICLAGILFIIARKFSVLANIDVNEIQTEKNALLKQQIIANQLRRRFSHVSLLFAKILKPFSRFLRNSFDGLYDSLNAWQRNQANKEAALDNEVDKRIETLLFEAEELVKNDRLEAAEKKYIEIIGLDAKNFRAFKELGDVYYRRENLNEAKQTFEHALNLRRKATGGDKETATKDLEVAQTHYALALVFEETGELAKAVTQLKRALRIEQNSPRYLDRLIEVSILKKDKIGALDAVSRLENANPENQKLGQFKERIADL